MAELNMANRQVCDVLIMNLKDKKPFMNFDTANTTTAGLSSDNVYARGKGSRMITYTNPLEGTMTIEAQVAPMRFYSLYSDGTIDNTATYGDTQTVDCTEAGKLTLTVPENGTIEAGTVFAFPADSFGVEEEAIAGAFADGVFTATEAEKIAVDGKYTVGYVINRTGVKKISFNNKKIPRDYYITMSTLDKDEEGVLTPFKMVAYKATVQRSFEMSFSSEGDPASVTMTLT